MKNFVYIFIMIIIFLFFRLHISNCSYQHRYWGSIRERLSRPAFPIQNRRFLRFPLRSAVAKKYARIMLSLTRILEDFRVTSSTFEFVRSTLHLISNPPCSILYLSARIEIDNWPCYHTKRQPYDRYRKKDFKIEHPYVQATTRAYSGNAEPTWLIKCVYDFYVDARRNDTQKKLSEYTDLFKVTLCNRANATRGRRHIVSRVLFQMLLSFRCAF